MPESLGKKRFVFKTFLDVDDVPNTVFVSSSCELLPAPVDVFSEHSLAIGDDVVLGAEVKYLLGCLDASDVRSGHAQSFEHETHLVDWMRSVGETKLDNDSVYC